MQAVIIGEDWNLAMVHFGPTNVNYSYLDGSVNHDNWYYAIGSYKQWGTTEGCYNAIPAADEVAGYYCGVQSVELWVK
jgi:hypothetical protein